MEQEIEINFNISSEDLFAFEHHRITHVNNLGFTIMRLTSSTLISLFLLILLHFFINIPVIISLVLLLTVFILIFNIFPIYRGKRLKKRIDEMYKRQLDTTIFGQKKLILNQNGINETSMYREESVNWNEIKSVWETGKYFFIYFGATNAFIFPKRFLRSITEFTNSIKKFASVKDVLLTINQT